jgi:hypothetical protein
MESISAHLGAVKQKFPGQVQRIEELFKSNEDFRTLCSDYFLCMQSLQKLKKETSQKDKSIEEFNDTSLELEQELYNSIFDE